MNYVAYKIVKWHIIGPDAYQILLKLVTSWQLTTENCFTWNWNFQCLNEKWIASTHLLYLGLLSTVRHVSMIFCHDGLCKFVTTHTVNDFATVNTLIFSVYLMLNISQLYKFDANVL